MTALRQEDVVLGKGAHVRCEGKGRKERCTPLTKSTVTVLAEWLREQGQRGTMILFPTARGGRLSADAVQYLVSKYEAVARRACSTLSNKRVTPHLLRHTAAMELLLAGVDRAVIALWLGHESVETTQIYLDADLAMKRRSPQQNRAYRSQRGPISAGRRITGLPEEPLAPPDHAESLSRANSETTRQMGGLAIDSA
jgi:site-specific recombinase XerD